MQLRKIEQSFAFIVVGASGDLAQLKIFPAMYSLAEQKRFPKDFVIMGFARTIFSEQEFKDLFAQSVRQNFKGEVHEEILASLLDHVTYIAGSYDEASSYQKIDNYLSSKQGTHWQKVAYLAVPPQLFGVVAKNIAEAKQSDEEIKLVLEKPFGTDATSATALFKEITSYFSENEIYLLDHYLGKEGTQSILSLRHANRILNHLLSGHEIANIQITAFEELNVGKRLGYFDAVGIVKDMVQSHLLQVLALITMSIPVKESARSFQREKLGILSALHFAREEPQQLVVGQYASYQSQGENVAQSQTETFAAMTLFIDKLDWHHVPVFIRTGKKLSKRKTEVVVEFKKLAFQDQSLEPNRLIINIQPDERIEIQLLSKVGGTNKQYRTLTTSDSIACFGDDCLPEHGRLLMDVLQGERMFFLSFAEVLASWRLIDEIIAYRHEKKVPLLKYNDGAHDVTEANVLPEQHGFKWY